MRLFFGLVYLVFCIQVINSTNPENIETRVRRSSDHHESIQKLLVKAKAPGVTGPIILVNKKLPAANKILPETPSLPGPGNHTPDEIKLLNPNGLDCFQSCLPKVNSKGHIETCRRTQGESEPWCDIRSGTIPWAEDNKIYCPFECKCFSDCKKTGDTFWCSTKARDDGHNRIRCLDLCAQSPCKDRGTCINTGNDFKCQCNRGFSGKTCEILVSITD